MSILSMKIYQIYFIILVFLTIFTLCDQTQDILGNLQDTLKKLNETDPEEIKQNLLNEEEEFSRELIEEMGINKMDIITKETFRTYITRMINTATDSGEVTENEISPDEEEFFNYLIDEIMNEIPNQMNQEEFKLYSNTERYKAIVERIMQEKFGENYTDEIIKMMSGSFENISNSDLSDNHQMEELMRKLGMNTNDNEMNDENITDDEIENLDGNEEKNISEVNANTEDNKNEEKNSSLESKNSESEEQSTNDKKSDL